jgi:hypothetical protein
MPPGRTALTSARDVVRRILARRRLKLVPMNGLKSVSPRVVRRDPAIRDLELFPQPL